MRIHILIASMTTAIALAGCDEPPSSDLTLVTIAPDGARVIRSESGALTAPSTEPPTSVVREFLRARGAGPEVDELYVTRDSPAVDGIAHLGLGQRVAGRRVVGAYVKAALTEQGELVHLIEHVRSSNGFLVEPIVDEHEALHAALDHLGYAVPAPTQIEQHGPLARFTSDPRFYRAPTVERVALEDVDGRLAEAFLVETWTARDNLLDHTLVDGRGAVVSVERRTADEAYFAFPISPAKGPQELLPGDGWLGNGAQYVNHIHGNNARAYLDVDANNAPDAAGATVPGDQFTAVIDFASAPSAPNNRAVAVQNLFYFTNKLHDILYHHGFDESAGNFQVDNFGLGGLGNDAVHAEAQDGSGVNNANFAAPPDGGAPRMQMYLYTGPRDALITIGGVSKDATIARFGGALTTTAKSGALKLFADKIAPTGDACTVHATKINKAIALIEPGGCDWVVKVYNAQQAGAVLAIVINALDGPSFSMTGTDTRITIPAVMVTQTDGAWLRARVGQSTSARKNPVASHMIDASFDGDIIAHEYGHGLTWRMIGGMSGKIAGAIGEGASDVLAFLVNGDDRIGEYARANPFGNRRYPYSGYPLTYRHCTGTQVHGDGEPYAAAMWRVLELYLAAGFSRDDLLRDFVQGMNYTPQTPAFENMRDGMLQAADESRDCLIWRGFAQYGVGVGASGTILSNGTVKIVESFTVPAICQ